MAIHENLRNLRLAANMTQEQAAEQIGITRQGLSSYETGRTLPDIEMLKHLAELFADSLILAITFLGALILLIICVSGRSRYRIKDRLVSVAVCSGTILLIAFLFGISDHIYTITDYLITPLLVTARLCIFLLLDMLIEKVQKRKRTGDRC